MKAADAANVQDRDGTKGTLLGLYLTAPRCRFVFAGRLVGWTVQTLRTTLHTTTRSTPWQTR